MQETRHSAHEVARQDRLRAAIVSRIEKDERRRAAVYLSVSATTTVFSLLGIVFSLRYAVQGFYQSSFYSYASLLFSDPDVTLSYWRELTLSLLEALPLLGVMASLVALAALLVSIRTFAENMRTGWVPSFNH